MKLIIDIDKDIAQGIIDGKGEMPRNIVRSFQATIADAIKNGIPLEEELEKIKAEIEEHNRNYISDDNAGLERAIYDFIEPHIAELKGDTE